MHHVKQRACWLGDVADGGERECRLGSANKGDRGGAGDSARLV